jgi:hypothetical protein
MLGAFSLTSPQYHLKVIMWMICPQPPCHPTYLCSLPAHHGPVQQDCISLGVAHQEIARSCASGNLHLAMTALY